MSEEVAATDGESMWSAAQIIPVVVPEIINKAKNKFLNLNVNKYVTPLFGVCYVCCSCYLALGKAKRCIFAGFWISKINL